MIILNATDKSLEVVLDGAVTTNELPIVAAFVDVTTTTYVPAATDTITNGTTPVTAVAAPAAATQRQVKLLTVQNEDTVDAIVKVQYNNNTTIRLIVVITLAPGSTLVYTDGEGFRVINSAGQVLTSGSGGGTPGGADTQVQFNDAGAFGGDAGLTYDKTTDELTVAGDIVAGDEIVAGAQALLSVRQSTAPGSDNARVAVAGGGGLSTDDGAIILVAGNEHATQPGWAQVSMGNVAGAKARIMRPDGNPAINLAVNTQGGNEAVLLLNRATQVATGDMPTGTGGAELHLGTDFNLILSRFIASGVLADGIALASVDDAFSANVGMDLRGLPVGLSLGQLKWPAVPAPSSDPNTLDTYEEGTWVPAIEGNVSESGQAYSVQAGRYIKIGGQVVCWGRVTLSTLGTITGFVEITGFPFISINVANIYGGGGVFYWANMTTAVTQMGIAVNQNATRAALYGIAAASVTMGTFAQADLSNTTDLIFAVTYRAED